MGELAASHDALEDRSYNQKEGFVKYISVPALGSIAAVTIAVELWRKSQLTDELKQHASKFSPGRGFNDDERHQSFHNMVEKILHRTSRLPLPHLLKCVISNIVRPIGFEILKFIDTEAYNDINYLEPIDSICWTMEGIIDKVKTLELRISAEQLENNYRRSCEYCLENQITNMWNQMSKELQDRFFMNKYDSHLQKYWTCFCRNDLHSFFRIVGGILSEFNGSIYKHVFEASLTDGNVLAVKYFWNKLTCNEINNNLMQWIDLVIETSNMTNNDNFQRSNDYTDILCFLLTQLDCKEQQREVFRKHIGILKMLLWDWPWQKYLLPTMQTMWTYLKIGDYNEIMSQIVREIKEGNTADELFRELWCDSPPMLKNYFIHFMAHDCLCGHVWKILRIENGETVKLILSGARAKEKKRIMFTVTKYSSEVFNVIYADQLHVLDMLIAETLPLERDIKSLKQSIAINHGNKLCYDWICSDKWQNIDKFLNWCFTDQGQIARFKTRIINKRQITVSLVSLGNYDVVDKFMIWCFRSENDINQFKKKLVFGYNNSVCDIVVQLNDWCTFEKFISWCFNSEKNINKFKVALSQYTKLQYIIRDIIVYGYNFEFANKLVRWCFGAIGDIIHFKKKLILSETGMEIFGRFVNNYKVYDAEFSNWELVKELTKWYHPIPKSVIAELKKSFNKNKHDYFHVPKCVPFYSPEGQKQALFYLLDHFAVGYSSGSGSNFAQGKSSDSSVDDNIPRLLGESLEEDPEDGNWSMDSDAVRILSNLMDLSDIKCDSMKK